MTRVLVVPAPSILSAMTFSGVAAGAAGAAALTTPTRTEMLQRRHEALARFAHAVTHPGIVALGLEAGTEEEEPQILAALGAIILDEEQIDRQALESSEQARVFDNVQIPLIAPVHDADDETEEIAESHSGADFWHLDHIGIDAARSQGLSGKGILVGVLDTGVDASHPEFAGKSVHFAEFDRSGKLVGHSTRDAESHGTHVCGLVAGQRAGVAPDADLAVAAVLTVKTPKGMTGYLVQIARGLDWLLTSDFRDDDTPGVDLLNASLGSDGYNDRFLSSLALHRSTSGTQMVAAIGNFGELGQGHHGSPGNYDVVIGVGATDRSDRVASFSDWGRVAQHGGIDKPDLCAPGVGIWSSVPNGYAAKNGSSMASPIVAGTAALLLQQDPYLDLDAPRLTQRILSLTKTPPTLPRGGHGRIDLSDI